MKGTVLRGRGADKGFTLVELILAVIIIGVITVPLANVVIGYLKNVDATNARLIESHDVQIASAYWAQDVASLGTRSVTSPFPLTQSVETNVPYNSGHYPCGSDATSTTPSTPNAIVRLAWDDFSGPGAAAVVRVVYVVVPTASGPSEMHRLRCQGSAAVVSDVTLAHDLDPSTPPALTCSTTCSGTGLMPAPKTVTLTLTLKDPKNLGAAYVVPLTGQRRQS